MELATQFILFITFFALAGKRLLTYMHVLQQEEYDSGRMRKWIFENGVWDKRLSMSLISVGFFWIFTFVPVPVIDFLIPPFFINFLVFICFIVMAFLEDDPRKNSKKKLVITARVKRTFFPALALTILLSTWCFATINPWLWILTIQAIPFVLIIVNTVMKPFEEIIQASYWNEAKTKLNELQPKIIAITGSYGKTSVKHILGHILKTQAPTLVTPGSVNTAMGITRIIREELTPDHKYFVVEMGAYGPGSIQKLCDLTPPDYGIITTIGHAHYERFRSLETVSEAKFELANAVIKNDGKVVIHERTLRFPYPRGVKSENPDNFTVVGEPQDIDPHKRKDVSYLQKNDVHIVKVEQQPHGLDIKLKWKDKIYGLEIPLYGIHHGHNAALAFVMAMEIGIEPENIQAAIKTTPQIEHRLELKKQPDGTTIIDDAFNSNPIGFRSALDLLSIIGNEGRKILITPGMVELGIAHNEAHQKLGEYAGQVCDVAIVVTPNRIPTFISGFKPSGKTLVEVDTFDDAQQWVAKNKQDKDIILIENDLPDMYERIPKM